MIYLLKNILSIKTVVSLTIIIFIFGIFFSLEANAISLTSDPAVSNLKATTATVSWPTDESGDSLVYYVVATGPSWHSQDKKTSLVIDTIDFVNTSVGFAGGRNGVIIKTVDGGKNWNILNSGTSYSIWEINAVDINNIWAVSQRQVLKSTNGGLNWSIIYTSAVNLTGLYVNNNFVWVSTVNGSVLNTNDGGATWRNQPTGVVQVIYDIDGSGDKLWVVTQNGAIIHSPDGGTNWSVQGQTGVWLYEVEATDENNVWVVGNNGVIAHSSDAGNSWINQNSGTSNFLYDIDSINSSTLYAAGGGGVTVYTNNSGNSWTSIAGPSVFTFNCVSLIKNQVFYAAGDQMYFYGLLNYSNKYEATLTTSHSMILANLAPLTKYYYYVCSRNSGGEEVCSNDFSFTTLAACPDGTDDGSCNLGQQYCQGTTLMPLDGTKNCVHCGYACPTATPYCNNTLEACEAKCSDGTSPGLCNAAKQYCDPATFQLSNSCSVNNTRCGYSCSSTDPYCNAANGTCEKKCSDGTAFNACSSATNQYCLNGSFFPDSGPNCVECSFDCLTLPSTPYCDEDDSHACIARCPDGTESNQCNASLKYCDPVTYQLSNNCFVNQTKCGYACPSANVYCNSGNGLCESGCNSGTPVGSCFGTQYCQSANIFVNNCKEICGYNCPLSTPYCNAAGQCEPKCPDGTAFNTCNMITHQFCQAPGIFFPATGENCEECRFNCAATSKPYCDRVITHGCVDRCEDGTARGDCNLVTKKYCDAALQLVNDCRQDCGYICSAATPQCEEDTGACIADTEPPVISNINIEPSYNSAVLTFDTKDAAGNPELAQAHVAVLLNADCTLPDSENLYKFIYSDDYFSSFNILMNELLPSTTYYLNIGVWDMADNFFATCPPASVISFKTLDEPDTEAPAVRILTPAQDEEISASYNITVEASDNVGVTQVDLILDDAQLLNSWDDEPYEFTFITTGVKPGDHWLYARAFDAVNNSIYSDRVDFTIINDATPPVLSEINVEVSLDQVSGLRQAVITWKTDEPADSRVDYAIEIEGSYDHSYGDDKECIRPEDCVKDDTLTLSHSLELKNLEANSRYHYRITSCDAKNNCAH